MKRLDDFKKDEVNTKSFTGGLVAASNIIHTQQERNHDSDGCCEIAKDWFCDSNGDGVWGKREPGQTCDGIWVYSC